MGVCRTFQCDTCGYEFFGSGGADRGFISIIQTFECTACEILFDTQVRNASTKRDKVVYCDKCKERKHLKEWSWKISNHCPKGHCEGTMNVVKNGELSFWD